KMHPRVLEAMAAPAMNHRGPEFKEILSEIRGLTQYLFATSGEVAVLSGSGTAGLEAAVSGLLRKQDRVLNLVNGKFSERFHELCQVFTTPTALSFEWGTAVDPGKVAAALDSGDFHAVTLCWNETSTGLTNPIAEVAKVVKEHDVFLIVDGITAVGGLEAGHPFHSGRLALPGVPGGIAHVERGRARESDRAHPPARRSCEGRIRRARSPVVSGSPLRVEYGDRSPISGGRRRQRLPEGTSGEARDRRRRRTRALEGPDLPDRPHGHLRLRGPRGGIPSVRGHAGGHGSSGRPRSRGRRVCETHVKRESPHGGPGRRPSPNQSHRQVTGTSSVR